MAEIFTVEVCYAATDKLERIEVQAESGWTIQQTIQASGISQAHRLDLTQNRVGIFGKLKTLETIVRVGDRIEIYRPLQINPNAARLRQAEKSRKAKINAASKANEKI